MTQKENSIIDIKFKDEKTGEIIKTKQIKNDIFVDATKKTSWLRKKYLKFLEKIINRTIRHAEKNIERNRRFHIIHKIVKQKLVHRGLRLCERLIGKHMIKSIEDIPSEPHNNHQRMWLDCWLKSLDDMWRYHIYIQGKICIDEKKREKFNKRYPDVESYIKERHKTNKPSHHGRTLMGQLYITEVMEDTVDRTMSDCFMMRVAHTMMEFYGINSEERNKIPKPGEYPVYLSNNEKNQSFFIKFANVPVWYPKDSKEMKILDLERENQELKIQLENIKKCKNKPTKNGDKK